MSRLKRLLAMCLFVAGGCAAEGLRPVSCTLLHVARHSAAGVAGRRDGARHKV